MCLRACEHFSEFQWESLNISNRPTLLSTIASSAQSGSCLQGLWWGETSSQQFPQRMRLSMSQHLGLGTEKSFVLPWSNISLQVGASKELKKQSSWPGFSVCALMSLLWKEGRREHNEGDLQWLGAGSFPFRLPDRSQMSTPHQNASPQACHYSEVNKESVKSLIILKFSLSSSLKSSEAYINAYGQVSSYLHQTLGCVKELWLSGAAKPKPKHCCLFFTKQKSRNRRKSEDGEVYT